MGATTRDQVADIVAAELGCTATTIVDSADMRELGADSLDVIGIVMRVEDECGVTITDDEADLVATFGDLVALVERKRGEA